MTPIASEKRSVVTGEDANTGSNKRSRVCGPGEVDRSETDHLLIHNEKPLLVVDVFSIVMSMLAPKEMLRLSCCSKSLMRMVNHETVVRNTIMLGGHSRNSLKGIMELLRNRKIFFPSPLRLLRVACGQRCEIPGCGKTVHTIRAHYGVFCCFRCVHAFLISDRAVFNDFPNLSSYTIHHVAAPKRKVSPIPLL